MLADSAVGVTVYSSAEKGWVTLGGTSVGAPFVAGLYGAANDYGAGTVGAPRPLCQPRGPQPRDRHQRKSERSVRILT